MTKISNAQRSALSFMAPHVVLAWIESSHRFEIRAPGRLDTLATVWTENGPRGGVLGWRVVLPDGTTLREPTVTKAAKAYARHAGVRCVVSQMVKRR